MLLVVEGLELLLLLLLLPLLYVVTAFIIVLLIGVIGISVYIITKNNNKIDPKIDDEDIAIDHKELFYLNYPHSDYMKGQE